eukprot:3714771-Rhodomonas_salina.1
MKAQTTCINQMQRDMQGNHAATNRIVRQLDPDAHQPKAPKKASVTDSATGRAAGAGAANDSAGGR